MNQQRELEEERMRKELDCLLVVHKHGLEGTADILASSLGLSAQWRQEKSSLAERRAA